jgi:hypothetical protein
MTTTVSMAQFGAMGAHPHTHVCVGDGVPADSPALLLHECFREYSELQKTYRWWRRKEHVAALRSYNHTLQQFHQSLARHNGHHH